MIRTFLSPLQKLEVRVLLRSFARAFRVEAPSLRGVGAGDSLAVYRSFTASCMEMVHDVPLRRYLRRRLGEEATALGHHVRRLVPSSLVSATVVLLYAGIGIDLSFEANGSLVFASCAFAKRYTPGDCLFMSAFDEGFVCGAMGIEHGELRFLCRLTEGAPCCKAYLVHGAKQGGAS